MLRKEMELLWPTYQNSADDKPEKHILYQHANVYLSPFMPNPSPLTLHFFLDSLAHHLPLLHNTNLPPNLGKVYSCLHFWSPLSQRRTIFCGLTMDIVLPDKVNQQLTQSDSHPLPVDNPLLPHTHPQVTANPDKVPHHLDRIPRSTCCHPSSSPHLHSQGIKHLSRCLPWTCSRQRRRSTGFPLVIQRWTDPWRHLLTSECSSLEIECCPY